MRLFHLSLSYKIPLWGGLLIVVSVLTMSAALTFKAYEDLREDMHISADTLGRILARTLFPVLLHDNIWHAYEQINAALAGHGIGNPVQPELIFVVDADARVLVSTAPRELPVLARLDSLGPDFARLAAYLASDARRKSSASAVPEIATPYFVFPIRKESAEVGTLVLAYSRDAFTRRFQGLAQYGLLIGTTVLAILLPINWYWGRRMARPLVDLARRMGNVMQGTHRDTPRETYPYQDELGRLFQAYDAMLVEMREKALLERELLKTERLTAVGRMASGIAHEINNPLGGMLMALDNTRARGGLPEHAGRTLGLIERGLKQIQETVAALLVEARDPGRMLELHDLEDVRTLIHPQTLKKSQRLDWQVALPGGVRLPAAACRQILINLLLNAAQATPEEGRISVRVEELNGELRLEVVNQSEPIPRERMEHLFEPFAGERPGGHGLGLWVTYQIVQQLGGRITAGCDSGEVRFEVRLPLEEVA